MQAKPDGHHGGPMLQTTRLVGPAVVVAGISQAWLTVVLDRHFEPIGASNPRVYELGTPLTVALCAAVVMLVVVGCLLLRDALRSGFFPAEHAGGRAGRLLAGVGACAAGVGVSFMLGWLPALVAGMLATGGLFYVAVGRFIPSVGIVTLALLATLTMALPNPWLTFGYPLGLTLLHATVFAAGHHQLSESRPAMGPGDWVGVCAGWVFWSFGLAVMTFSRTIEANSGAWMYAGASLRWSWVAPLVSLVLCLVLIAPVARLRSPGARSRGMVLLGCGGLVAHNIAWLIGLGLLF